MSFNRDDAIRDAILDYAKTPKPTEQFCQSIVRNADVAREGSECFATYRGTVFHHAHLTERVKFAGHGATEAGALSDLYRDCMSWKSKAGPLAGARDCMSWKPKAGLTK